MPGPADVEGFKQALTLFRTAFPNLKVVVEGVIGEGEKVVVRYTMSGIHKADFMGIAPTGKRISVGGIGVYRLEGARLSKTVSPRTCSV